MAEVKAAASSPAQSEDKAIEGAEAVTPETPVVAAPAAPTAAPPAATPTAAAVKPKTKRYVVTGAAVVLPLEGGSEQYLYRGAPVGEGFTAEGIKHALALGLIALVK